MSALQFPWTSSNFFSMPNDRALVRGLTEVGQMFLLICGVDILKCQIVKDLSDMLVITNDISSSTDYIKICVILFIYSESFSGRRLQAAFCLLFR